MSGMDAIPFVRNPTGGTAGGVDVRPVIPGDGAIGGTRTHLVPLTKRVLGQSSIEGLVERKGLEPSTFCLQSSCAPELRHNPMVEMRRLELRLPQCECGVLPLALQPLGGVHGTRTRIKTLPASRPPFERGPQVLRWAIVSPPLTADWLQRATFAHGRGIAALVPPARLELASPGFQSGA